MPDDEKKEDQKSEEKDEQKQQEEQKEEKKEEKEETFKLKIDGAEREVTREELITLAQKSGGANKRFQDAAKANEEARVGIRIKELFNKLSDSTSKPSKTDLKELAALTGQDLTELEEMLTGDDEEDEEKDDKTKKAAKKSPAGHKVALEDMPPEVQESVERDKKRKYEEAIGIIQGDCKIAIDKDKVLGKLIDSKDGEAKMASLSEMVFYDVQRRILSGEKYGPEMVASSVQAIRARVKTFGTPSGASEYPGDLSVMMGLGQSAVLPTEVLSETPIERVDSTDATKYVNNFVRRFQQSVVKGIRNRK